MASALVTTGCGVRIGHPSALNRLFWLGCVDCSPAIVLVLPGINNRAIKNRLCYKPQLSKHKRITGLTNTQHERDPRTLPQLRCTLRGQRRLHRRPLRALSQRPGECRPGLAEALRCHAPGTGQPAPRPPVVGEIAHGPVRENFLRLAQESRTRARARSTERLEPAAAEKQSAVLRLINAYRYRGHQAADRTPSSCVRSRRSRTWTRIFINLGPADWIRSSTPAPSMRPTACACARSSPSWGRSTAAAWAPSTCTSPTPRRSAGSRSGWRAIGPSPELEHADRRWLLALLTPARGLRTLSPRSATWVRSASRWRVARP